MRVAVKHSPPPSHLHRRYLECHPGIPPQLGNPSPPQPLSPHFNGSNTVLQQQHIRQCEPVLKHNPPAVNSTNVVCLLPSLLLLIPVLFCPTPNPTLCDCSYHLLAHESPAKLTAAQHLCLSHPRPTPGHSLNTIPCSSPMAKIPLSSPPVSTQKVLRGWDVGQASLLPRTPPFG